MATLGRLLMPNMLSSFNAGVDRSQQQRTRSTLAQFLQPAIAGDKSALAQIYAADPAQGVQAQQLAAQQQQAQQTQQVDHAKKLNGAAQFMLSAWQSGDPARVDGAWQSVRPYLAEVSGKEPPAQFDPAMLPAIYKVIGQTGGMPQQPAGVQEFQQMTQGLTPEQVAEARRVKLGLDPRAVNSGEVATLRAVQSDPGLLATYQKLHPRPAGNGGGAYQTMTPQQLNAAGLPEGTLAQVSPNGQIHVVNKSDTGGISDDAAAMLAAAGHQGYKIPIPSLGMKSSGGRAKYLNKLAEDLKASGTDLPTAVRNMVFGETGIFATKQMQKTYGQTMQNEMSAMKQADIALDVSSKFGRGDVQALNNWWTTGKKQFGSSEAQQYANAINTFAEEYAKVMSGANGSASATDSARQRSHEMISTGLSQGQMEATIALMKREMRARSQAQLDALQQQVVGLRNFGEDGAPQGVTAPAQTQAPQQPAASAGWSIEPVQ